MKYQCYYNKVLFIGERQYIGEKIIIPEAVFDTELEAEMYCDEHVEYQQHGDEVIELSIGYDVVA